jgi:hypothetical protein
MEEDRKWQERTGLMGEDRKGHDYWERPGKDKTNLMGETGTDRTGQRGIQEITWGKRTAQSKMNKYVGLDRTGRTRKERKDRRGQEKTWNVRKKKEMTGKDSTKWHDRRWQDMTGHDWTL